MAVDAEIMVIPAGSLSYCSCFVADADVATAVDADLNRGQRIISSAFFPGVNPGCFRGMMSCACCSSASSQNVHIAF